MMVMIRLVMLIALMINDDQPHQCGQCCPGNSLLSRNGTSRSALFRGYSILPLGKTLISCFNVLFRIEFQCCLVSHLRATQETVYGKRDGVIQGLAITHKDSRNLLRKTPGWKSGCILDVAMLPRRDMFKPDPVTLINIYIISEYIGQTYFSFCPFPFPAATAACAKK